jgi:alkylhydroperoxidase family enzyme
MSESKYKERQGFEMGNWPELRSLFNDLIKLVLDEGQISQQLKFEVFTVASLSAGCRHCQSHGAVFLDKISVDVDRIKAIWEYETSDLFDEAERAALDLARLAGLSPNLSEPENFDELRKYYSDRQIIEIVAVISLGGWLNRWNDTFATVTDQESLDFATEHLSEVGWEIGKHVGETKEQRKAHPSTLGWGIRIENGRSV